MGCHISITELSLMAIDLLRDFTNLSLQRLSPMRESDMITLCNVSVNVLKCFVTYIKPLLSCKKLNDYLTALLTA